MSGHWYELAGMAELLERSGWRYVSITEGNQGACNLSNISYAKKLVLKGAVIPIPTINKLL